jgi:hypothetical protein
MTSGENSGGDYFVAAAISAAWVVTSTDRKIFFTVPSGAMMNV